MSRSSVYDLESVKLPRASGALLALLTLLAESPLTRSLILPSLIANWGLPRIRAQVVDEPPTFLPITRVEQPARTYDPPALSTVPRQPCREGEEFRFWTVRDYHAAYRSGRTTPEVVAQRVIDAIRESDRLSPAMRCLIASSADDIRMQARASAERWRAGIQVSEFDGVPVAVKDEFDMLPYPTTAGTRFLKRIPTEDATVASRMRAAGAVLIGKANMHEIGIQPNSVNPYYGVARNPYNPAHDAGGSSSGPAVAVALGLAPVALGADGGGSIRIPAAHCGIVGLKATFGRVSETGAVPLAWSVAHIGPLAATAEDAALAYAVIAGPDDRDANSQHQPRVSVDKLAARSLKGIRLGIFPEWFVHATPEIVAACQTMVNGLVDQGAEVVEIEIPELYNSYVAHSLTILSEMLTFLQPYERDHWRDLSYVARLPLATTRTTSPNDYLHAQRLRTRIIRHFNDALREADVIVTPSTALTAPAIPEHALPQGESNLSEVIEIMRFAHPANFTGLPAISVPAGYDSAGMPVGLQIMGRAWDEALLLRLAYTAGPLVARRKPRVWFDVLGEAAGG